MNRMYQMGQQEYKNLLKVAKEQVSFGIYAVERKGYAELRNDSCNTITQLKKMKQDFKRQGYKVYSNGD